MAIPPRSPFNVVSRLRREAGNSVFDGTSEDVAVVGEAGGEGRPVVEGELRLPLGLLQGGLEGVQLLP